MSLKKSVRKQVNMDYHNILLCHGYCKHIQVSNQDSMLVNPKEPKAKLPNQLKSMIDIS